MKRIFILAMALALTLTVSCKRGKQEATEPPKPEPQPAAPTANPMAMPEKPGKIVEPENFFKFEVERRGVQKEQMGKIYKLLKETKTYGPELESKIRELSTETTDKFKEVGTKYEIAYEGLKTTFENMAARQKIDDYVTSHPELKKQLDESQETLKKLSEDINAEMTRLRPPEQPPPGAPGP